MTFGPELLTSVS